VARPYRLGKRAEAVARSRERIVAAARSLLAAPEYAGFSVEAVSEASGVSRPTVYNQFESKRGIVEAVFEDIGARIRYDRVHAALADPNPLRALDRSVVEHCRAWARDPQVIRRVLGLATIDAELAVQVAHHEAMRRDSYGALVARLSERRMLSPKLNEKDATTMLGLITSFTTYDELVTKGVSRTAIVRVLKRLARAVVVRVGG